ncbi:MAG: hypothetical protein JST79_10500 [Acidobacteria bacterium]|nr:hypothetical protein [Acidobacteriota bacterium]
MKHTLAWAVLFAAAWGQSIHTGGSTTNGQAAWSALSNRGASPAQLPQNWVNQHQCDVALNNPDVLKRVRNTGGDYAGTQAGLQQALNDAEALRVAEGKSSKIVVDTDVTITVTSSETSITMPNNGYSGSACVVIASSNPLQRTTQVGSLAIQSISRSAGVVTVNTFNPHGLSSGDTALMENVTGWQKNFNGTFPVTVTSPTQFSYAQAGSPNESGTVSFPFTRVSGPNTLAQQVANNFFRLRVSASNVPVMQGAAGSHHWAWFDADISSTAGQNDAPLVQLGNASNNTAGYAGEGFHMGLSQTYIHGCASGVASTTPVWPAPVACAADLKTKDAIRLMCGDCWLTDSMIDQILYAGVESHLISSYPAQGPVKITNNHLRGGSIGILFGGAQPSIDLLVPSDIEIRLNSIELDPNWYMVSSFANPTRSWLIKNRFELKNASRVVFAGNRVRYSWADSQRGSLSLLTPRGDGYWGRVDNVTIENNLWEHGNDWFQTLGRDGAAQLSMPLQRVLVRNNLVSDIVNPTWGNSSGQTTALPIGLGGNTYSCAVARSGNVASLSACSCSSGSSCPYTGVSTGDWVHTLACSDSSFNASKAPALSSDPFTSGPITFANNGPDVTSGVTCTLDNAQGYPQFITFDHNTVITQGKGTGVRSLLADLTDSGTDPSREQAANLTYKNSIMSKATSSNNWVWCSANTSEGTSSAKAAACVDNPTFSFHHLALFGPGGTASNYSEWNPAGTQLASLSTLRLLSNGVCSSTPNQNCAGFVNNLSSTADPEYHNYGLLSTSYYKAGQPGQADDGKDLGVDLNELDAAFVQGQYVCRTFCGSGPYAQ